MSTVSWPTSAARSRKPRWTMPSGSSADEPRPSLAAGMPNRISPPTPAATASAAALRRLSLVCCTTPGIDATGCGSAMPSFTNRGSTRLDGRTATCATSRRSGALRRSLLALVTGKPGDISLLVGCAGLPDPAACSAAPLAGLTHRLSRLDRRVPQAGTMRGEPLDQGRHRWRLRDHVHAQAELSGRLARLRADHRDHGHRVRLAGDSDQVTDSGRGGEQDRVKAAALGGLPDRRGWLR